MHTSANDASMKVARYKVSEANKVARQQCISQLICVVLRSYSGCALIEADLWWCNSRSVVLSFAALLHDSALGRNLPYPGPSPGNRD